MKSSLKLIKIDSLKKEYNAQKLNFDLAIQRQSDIWDTYRKSALIHSILTNCPIPELYVIEEEVEKRKIKSFLDGKQRMMAIIDFIGCRYALDKKILPVNEEVIAGKYFNELPEEMQLKIREHKLKIEIIEDISNEEIEQLFYKLNNGVPLNGIETTRALLGVDIIQFLQSISNTPFFEKKVNISNASKKRYKDQELVLQVIKLIYEPTGGFSAKEMKPFIESLRNKNLKDRLSSALDNALYYLQEAFPTKEKYLKKVNVPILIMLVLEIYERELTSKITRAKFYDWANEFLNNPPQEYKDTVMAGSASKEKVQRRYNVMRESFYKRFNLDELDKEELSRKIIS